ncbi:MAG TPA: hypothetical protein ENN49_00785 [Bacteroidales bacterium]|nr:hypothetical protein [Bacteroidales bacterium]
MIYFYRAITLISLICIVISAKTQNVINDIYTSFENYTTKDGLSHNLINDLYQDSFGYLWIGTEHGLNRFDGYSFVRFYHNPEDSLSISGNVITSIIGDQDGNLWIGTTDGLNYYNRSKNKFIRFLSDVSNPNSLKSNRIRKVLLDNNQILWIETVDGTLSQFNTKDNSFRHYTHKPITQPFYRYHALMVDRDGDIWVGGRNLSIIRFDRQNQKFHYFKAAGNVKGKKRDDDLASIIQTSNGQYYVGAVDGFYLFNPNNEWFEKLFTSSTYSLANMEDGNILMGTGYGLVIYNPEKKQFTRYLNNIDNPKSLIDNHINKVLVDRDKNIWIATKNGLSLLRSRSFLIEHFTHIPGNPATLSGNDITSILKDKQGRIWIGTKNHGLNLWDTSQNTFKHFSHDALNPNSLASDNINRIYEDREGILWIALWSGVGFNRFDPEKGQFTRYTFDPNSRKADWYNDILEDSKGNLWVGIWGGRGLVRFDRKKGEFKKETFYSSHLPINTTVKRLVNDGSGSLLVQTLRPIIFRYQLQSKSFAAHVSYDKCCDADSAIYRLSHHDLPFNFDEIYSIATNGKGITLIATNRGILVYNARSKIFSALGLNKEIVNLIYDDFSNCFWLFSSNEVFRLNSLSLGVQFVGKLKTTINLKESSLRCDKTGSIWCIQDKNVYLFDSEKLQLVQIGSSLDFPNFIPSCIANCFDGIVLSTREGLFYVNSKTRQFKSLLSSPRDSLILKNTTGIAMIDSSKLFLVSSYGFYFYHLREKTLKKGHFNSIPSDFSYSVEAIEPAENKIYLASNQKIYEMSISQNSIQQINIPDSYMVSSRLTTCLLEDQEGYIWIGTSDNGLNRLNPRTGLFDHFLKGNTPRSLPSEDVTCLYSCSRNKIWIGTHNGLCQYNQEDSTIVLILQNVITGRVESIIESSDSLIWIGTQNGLVRFDPVLEEWQLFNEADGLPAASFNNSSCNLSPVRLAFATESGVITINPKTFGKKREIDPVLISEFKILDQVISYAIHQNDTLTLKHNENSFSISFSSLTFDKVRVNQFSYTITGMKGNWVTTTSNVANFTNLNPGQYIFKVTRKGFENNADKHTLLNIVIKPPFWKTIGFRASVLVVLLFIGTFVLMLYINQLKAREHSVVLEQKLLASQMNPHFIFNTLSAIQNFIYNKDSDDAGNYLANFSMLVRLILENSRSEWITIDQEIKTIKLYLILQQLRFPNKFEYEIDVDPIINKKQVNIPPMLIQPFIENSIVHGIMHKKSMGNISIIFKLVDELVQIEVIDDGVGLKKSEIINRNRVHHTSLATQITRERLASLKRKFNERIGIAVNDRDEAEGENGVRVTLFVPYKKSFFRNS